MIDEFNKGTDVSKSYVSWKEKKIVMVKLLFLDNHGINEK